MSEDTPENGKNPMKEAINLLRDNFSAKNKKNDRLLSRYILGLCALIILLAIFVGFQQYYFSQRFDEMNKNLTNLEGRIASIEKQNLEFQTKLSNSAKANDVEALSSKVSALEIRRAPSQASKKSSTDSSRQIKAVKTRYHEVKKGETLYRISKQYGITVDELRRLNKLSPNQHIEVGQKLLVSKVGS
jgi:LysM repeat protein